MTTPEILWLVHTETVEWMKEHEPRKLRRYLTTMGDETTLIAWDQEQMKSRDSKK